MATGAKPGRRGFRGSIARALGPAAALLVLLVSAALPPAAHATATYDASIDAALSIVGDVTVTPGSTSISTGVKTVPGAPGAVGSGSASATADSSGVSVSAGASGTVDHALGGSYVDSFGTASGSVTVSNDGGSPVPVELGIGWEWAMSGSAGNPASEFSLASVFMSLGVDGSFIDFVDEFRFTPPGFGSSDEDGFIARLILDPGEDVTLTLLVDAFGVAAAPEPASLLLLAVGLAAAGGLARWRRA